MYICTYVTFLFDRSWLFYSFFFNTQQVEQRDVPGIDNAFLAMDTEEGVEVVWNEVQFSGNRNLKEQQVTIDLTVFSHNFFYEPFQKLSTVLKVLASFQLNQVRLTWIWCAFIWMPGLCTDVQIFIKKTVKYAHITVSICS